VLTFHLDVSSPAMLVIGLTAISGTTRDLR
jgi:hypothetical protein